MDFCTKQRCCKHILRKQVLTTTPLNGRGGASLHARPCCSPGQCVIVPGSGHCCTAIAWLVLARCWTAVETGVLSTCVGFVPNIQPGLQTDCGGTCMSVVWHWQKCWGVVYCRQCRVVCCRQCRLVPCWDIPQTRVASHAQVPSQAGDAAQDDGTTPLDS